MRLLNTLLLAFAAASLSAKPFEGTILYEISQDGQTREMTFRVKGAKMAFESPDIPGGKVIFDRDAMSAKVVMPQQRMVLSVPADRFVENAAGEPTGTFEVTDETRTILNHTARKVLHRDGGTESVLWLTGDLGAFQPLQGPLAAKVPPALQAAFPDGAMLLEMESDGPDGTMTLKTVRIDEGSIPAGSVDIPAGYQEMEMGGMMPGMGALPGMRR